MRPSRQAKANRRGVTGMVFGTVGVLGFSGTIPATRLAVRDLDPVIVGLGRALVAATLAGTLLVIRGERRPPREILGRIAIVAAGVVVGAPLALAIGLQSVPASHGAVVFGFLPLAIAGFSTLRGAERPTLGLWLASLAGLGAVIAFSASMGAGNPRKADAVILLGALVSGLGNAEGGALSREIGGWRVISWALVLSAPLVALIVAPAIVRSGLSARPSAWGGFAYISFVSMFLAFLPWFSGMARAGVARVGQLKLAMPALSLIWAALLLSERIEFQTAMAGATVIACAWWAQRAGAPKRLSSNRLEEFLSEAVQRKT